MNHASPPRALVLVALFVACFALLPGAQAAPCTQDGCDGFSTFQGDGALLNNTIGAGNTAFGWRSLFANTDGSFNTALGGGALVLNDGADNTAVGAAALLLNTTGHDNAAVGTDAMVFNDSGDNDVAVGAFALFDNVSGDDNTAVGFEAMQFNQIAFTNAAVGTFAMQNNDSSGAGTAVFNTAVGGFALQANVDGTENTAVGAGAMEFADGGSNNTAVGFLAGVNVTGSGNTFIGSNAGTTPPAAGDYNNTILLGILGDDDALDPDGRAYIGNIRDVATGNADAVAVLIDSDGQLGTINSSRRFKKDIKPMDQTSEAILALKPVTFHYKDGDTKKARETPQFGLIAEDVAAVNPDLIVRDKDGEIYSVRYDAVNVMLLSEFLKEHKKVEEQQASIADLKSTVALQRKEMQLLTAQLKEQAAQIQKVSTQLELSKSAPRTVASDR
jgi:Chaperone of endosialidase